MDETRERIIGEITALKMLLRDTDYEVTKYAEGLTDCTTQRQIEAYRAAFMEQYGEVIESRKLWRAKINELEAELAALGDNEDDPAPADEPEDDGYIEYPEYTDNGAESSELTEEETETEAPAPAEDDGAEGETDAETGEDQEQPEE